jgi:hypothetical protein
VRVLAQLWEDQLDPPATNHSIERALHILSSISSEARCLLGVYRGGRGPNYSYVGNLGRNLSRTVQMNACAPGPVVCLSRAAGTAGARRWSQFGTAFGQHTEGGNSTYSTGEIEISRRFNNGLLFDVNYAYARLLAYQYAAINPVVSALWRYDYRSGYLTADPCFSF